MAKCNFIIHVYHSRIIQNETIANEGRNYSPASVNILNRSYIFYHAQNSFYYIFFLSLFLFSTAFPSTMNLARHPAGGSIWGYFSAFHRATPWQAPLSSAIRCFYNESLFTGLSMRYLCYPILRLRASNWNFPSRESSRFDSSRWVSLSQRSTHTWNRSRSTSESRHETTHASRSCRPIFNR